MCVGMSCSVSMRDFRSCIQPTAAGGMSCGWSGFGHLGFSVDVWGLRGFAVVAWGSGAALVKGK